MQRVSVSNTHPPVPSRSGAAPDHARAIPWLAAPQARATGASATAIDEASAPATGTSIMRREPTMLADTFLADRVSSAPPAHPHATRARAIATAPPHDVEKSSVVGDAVDAAAMRRMLLASGLSKQRSSMAARALSRKPAP